MMELARVSCYIQLPGLFDFPFDQEILCEKRYGVLSRWLTPLPCSGCGTKQAMSRCNPELPASPFIVSMQRNVYLWERNRRYIHTQQSTDLCPDSGNCNADFQWQDMGAPRCAQMHIELESECGSKQLHFRYYAAAELPQLQQRLTRRWKFGKSSRSESSPFAAPEYTSTLASMDPLPDVRARGVRVIRYKL